MLEESVVYQDILRKGKRQGKQEGIQQGLLTIVQQQLERRLGKLSPAVQRQFEGLAVAQLEELGLALLEFQTPQDMQTWFRRQKAKV